MSVLPRPWIPALAAAALATTAATAATGCTIRGGKPSDTALEPIEGKVAEPVPADARVEIHRRDDFGLASPVVGFDVRPDAAGRFRTQPLPHGRYLVVLRCRDLPPAAVAVRLPGSGEVVLRPPVSSGGATIVLTAPGTRSEPLRCRLTAPAPRAGVLDLREFLLAPGGDVTLQGLEPGLWKLDVTNSAATTELAVGPGGTPQRFLVDPPPPSGAETGIEGTVLARNGQPARGVVVSGWEMAPDGAVLETWGRQSEVGADGNFRISGLRPGRGMVRVELRGAAHRLVPPPEMVEIPPSGKVQKSFRVDP